MKRGWACKIFHLRKSEGHQLLKTQHVSWLHYHIMDYWCDCQWGNCQLCLLRDGFLPDCRTWRTVKGPSSLISQPLEKKNKKKKTNSFYDLKRLFCTQFYRHSVHIYLLEYASPWPLYQNFSWLMQTEAFFRFCLIAIYARICLGTRVDDNGLGLTAAAGWNVSHFR